MRRVNSKLHLYSVYKRQCAKIRGYSFNITFEEFLDLTQKNCCYCGTPPNKYYKIRESQGFYFNGLDRIDNNRGYEKDNVAACCSDCNSAKMNSTTVEFFTRIKKCYEHLDLGNIKNAPLIVERGTQFDPLYTTGD